MGFGDGLNWMNEKLRQSVPDMTAARKACQRSYDLGRYASGKMSEGAEKLIEMGFGDGLNRMIEKLKQSVPDRTTVTKACEDSYNLARYASSKMNEGAEKLMNSEFAAKAAEYVADAVIYESFIRFRGGSIICRLARDGLYSLKGIVRPPGIDVDEAEAEFSEMIKRIEKLEEDNHMLMKRIEKPEDDNKLLRSELNKLYSKQTENSNSVLQKVIKWHQD